MIPHDPIEVMILNSYMDFHTKGLDYLCLARTPMFTVKAYFYDGPNTYGDGIVCPHDHRYPFSTTVLSGENKHYRYKEIPTYNRWNVYQKFNWLTPLNGGDGFAWEDQVGMDVISEEKYKSGDTYWCEPEEIHTISTIPGTVLLLTQHADTIPLDQPTSTYIPSDTDREPPSITGLYEQMTADRAAELLGRLRQLTGT